MTIHISYPRYRLEIDEKCIRMLSMDNGHDFVIHSALNEADPDTAIEAELEYLRALGRTFETRLVKRRNRSMTKHCSRIPRLCIPLALVLALASCRSMPPTVDGVVRMLRAAPDAKPEIVELLRKKKIVFLAETHSTVTPILFLAENLKDFHEAGMRYLFLEGTLPASSDADGYGFFVFYPWSYLGWKYEKTMLGTAVEALNKTLPEAERLKIVYPEKGNVDSGGNDPLAIPQRLNGRDAYASASIISTMDQARPGDKALIFYGGSHGSKLIWENFSDNGSPLFDWKPLGVYLTERYGKSFAALNFRELISPEYKDYFTEADWDSFAEIEKVVVPKNREAAFLVGKSLQGYDACVVVRDMMPGVFYQYAPTDANLRFMLGRLSVLEADGTGWKARAGQFRFDPPGQYLLYIYYLRLYFGELFDYDFWNPETSLASALAGLKAQAFAAGMKPSEKILFPLPNQTAMRRYHGIMVQSPIRGYLGTRNEKSLAPLAARMREAQSIFPADLWPLYWEAYAATSIAVPAEALELWKVLLAQPLARCMETYPNMLRMAARCARESGRPDEAKAYEAALDSLKNEHGMDIPDMKDVASAVFYKTEWGRS